MRKKRIGLFMIGILIAMIMGGCAPDQIDTKTYEDASVEIDFGDEMHEITIQELASFKGVTKSTHSTSDKIGKVRATGVYLTTVLEKYGKILSEFKKITFYGGDDYSISLDQDYLKKHKVILAYGIDRQPLEEDSIPLRVIIPKSDSAYWIRMVTKVECK